MAASDDADFFDAAAAADAAATLDALPGAPAEATAADIKHEVVRSEVPVMTKAGSGSYNATETYDGVTKVTGSFTIPVTYTSLGLLLKHCLRKTPTTTGPSGADYTHTYKLQRDAPTGGLTIEWVIGATGVTRVASNATGNAGGSHAGRGHR